MRKKFTVKDATLGTIQWEPPAFLDERSEPLHPTDGCVGSLLHELGRALTGLMMLPSVVRHGGVLELEHRVLDFVSQTDLRVPRHGDLRRWAAEKEGAHDA